MAIWAIENPTYEPAMRIISSITRTNPVMVTTSFNHGYSTGLTVRLLVPDGYGMSEINGLYSPITVTSNTTFTMEIDSRSFTPFDEQTEYEWDDLFRLRENEVVTDALGNPHTIPNSYAFNMRGIAVLNSLGALQLQWGQGVANRTDIDGNNIASGLRVRMAASPHCGTIFLEDGLIDPEQWADYVTTGAVPPGMGWLSANGIPANILQIRNGFFAINNYEGSLANKIKNQLNLWLVPSVYGIGHASEHQISAEAEAVMNIVNGAKAVYEEDFNSRFVNKQKAQVIPVGENNNTIYLATKNVLRNA